MKKVSTRTVKDEMRPEYDFTILSGGVRGKYYKKYLEGTNVVLLDPDVAREYRDSESVNKALRKIMQSKKSSSVRARKAF